MTNAHPDYTTLASKDSAEKTSASLKSKNYNVVILSSKTEALAKIKELIPAGASVMNGASVTLQQVGYSDFLAKGEHGWVDLHAKITSENNEAKRHEIRRQSVFSDYYIGSVHALTEEGDMVIASNSGSQLPHIVFTSPNLIFVVSTKKIVPDLAEAMNRLNKHVIPLEDKRMMNAMNMHTTLNKIVIMKGEPPFLGRKIHVILVEEDLGY